MHPQNFTEDELKELLRSPEIGNLDSFVDTIMLQHNLKCFVLKKGKDGYISLFRAVLVNFKPKILTLRSDKVGLIILSF
jgi:hypothetical protein